MNSTVAFSADVVIRSTCGMPAWKVQRQWKPFQNRLKEGGVWCKLPEDTAAI